MKNILFFLVIITISSCADEIEYPSTYEYAFTSIDFYVPLQIVNGEWTEPDFATVPEPSFATSVSPAFIEKLEFEDETTLQITDAFGTETVDYTGRVSFISFDKDGQRIEMKGQADGEQFTVQSISSGDYDGESQNIFISALCGDLVNCREINPYDWVSDPSGFSEGTIQYVIVKTDILQKS